MTRDEKLNALADVLSLAAKKALALSAPQSGLSREAALAKQIEGIAMEFRALGSRGHGSSKNR